jgi:origin recognition complex subunit 4
LRSTPTNAAQNLRQSDEFSGLLRDVYASSKTVAPVFNAAMLALSTVSAATPFPAAAEYVRSLAPPASNLSQLPSLSDLQLALLIAAARLEVLADTETVNFEMVYDEYLKLCATSRVQATPGGGGGVGRVWSKAVAVGAWERLESVALVVPVSAAAAAKRWRVDVGLAELREFVKGSQWARWCREVV